MQGTKHLRKLPPKTPPHKAKQGGVFVSATVPCNQKNPNKNKNCEYKKKRYETTSIQKKSIFL